MRVLFIGDIFAETGRQAVRALLPDLKKNRGIDLTIANIENAASGKGATPKIVDELFGYGIEIFTSGNHIWDRKEIFETLASEARLLRPANYPPGNPGRGWGVFQTSNGDPVGVLSICGRVFMDAIDCPFRCFDGIISEMKSETRLVIVDFHAETTSEKRAFGFYADGRASLVIGTHTHVPTSDEQILPKGAGYITDVGMTGPQHSVIGVLPEFAIKKFITKVPVPFEPARDGAALCGIISDLDPKTGKCLHIERVFERVN